VLKKRAKNTGGVSNFIKVVNLAQPAFILTEQACFRQIESQVIVIQLPSQVHRNIKKQLMN